ncbi:type VI secretion system Vgr family protein [Thiomonas sp. FB-6]|uniref:type VI secretion system Vgr family protein n=1 Tax=Thiomonas sp. FB-6 TaxID=1158291 RepID=UPI0003A077AC|nr:contractile injection system protein, VgrG/Pvc8 family [Thiomonas sp. FB-6]
MNQTGRPSGALAGDAEPPPGGPGRALQLRGEVLTGLGGERAWSVLALRGEEALDALFDHQLLLRREPGGTPCAPRELLGHALDLRIELGLPGFGPAPAPRWIHGLVSQAACLHEGPRGTLYALRLRPLLARSRLQGQCRAWRGRSVPEVLRELVQPLGLAVVERLRGPHAPQEYLVQFNQSDWEFFQRLSRQWGIRFWFEHRRGAHQLVLADYDSAALEQPAPAWRELGVGRVGERADHEALQELRLHRGLDGRIESAWGWGPLRGVAACHRLQLHDPRVEPAQREFLVLRSRLYLREQQAQAWPWSAGGPADAERACAGAALDADGFGDAGRPWDFSAPRGRVVDGWELHDELWLRPVRGALQPGAWSPPPRVRGLQSARVAQAGRPAPAPQGAEGEVHTEPLGRVRARLAWDWAGTPAGDSAGPRAGTPAGDAAGERAGTSAGDRNGDPGPATTPWIRVATPWAGRELGRVHIPRVGQEVLLGYLDGELERPLVLGAMYHAGQRPCWTLPRNRALGGLRSRELAPPGAEGEGPFPRGSQLVLDDTAGLLHAQLLCEHTHAGLALGCVARVEGEGGRGELRGVGAELRTDADGLLHSVQGMLLGSHGRLPDESPAADASEALRGLHEAALWRADALAAARSAGLDVPADAATDAPTDAPKSAPTDAQGFPQAGPELLLDGADGLTLAASRHAQFGAGAGFDLQAGERLGLHAGADLLAVAAQGLRVHVHRAGLRLLAASGELHVHACDGALLALARDQLCLRSAADLRVRAELGIVLGGGPSFVRLDAAGIDYGSPGPLLQRGAAPSLRQL